jgi:hypothetical protein
MSDILYIATVILAAAGAFSAYLGWIKSGEAFDARRFVNGTVTGVIAGISLAVANAAGIAEALDPTNQFILIVSLVLSVIGIDQLRVSVSGAIANRAEAEAEPIV